MLEANRIADVLGGPEVLGERITTLSALSAAVQKGLPKAALGRVAKHVSAEASEQRRLVYEIVPEATYKRRKAKLNARESERTERLARVVAMAEFVWSDNDAARRFLTTPHRSLSGRTPLEAAAWELGARQVEEILARVVHGLPA